MRRGVAVAIWVGVVLAVFALATGTRGGLAHFSPYTLEYTTQTEFTVFRGSWPIYRSSPRQVGNELVTFIRDEGFVTAEESGLRRWELIFHWNEAWRDGHGSLYSVFVRHRKEIIEWSRADRERARLYWSEGFKHLRSDKRVDVQTGRVILDTCWRCDSIQELRERIIAIKAELAESEK